MLIMTYKILVSTITISLKNTTMASLSIDKTPQTSNDVKRYSRRPTPMKKQKVDFDTKNKQRSVVFLIKV